MSTEPLRLRESLPGMLAVTATYVSFLLHAQFGFLSLAEQELGSARHLEQVMGAMGLTGLVVSLAVGGLLRTAHSRRLILTGFLSCALAALASLVCQSTLAFTIVAALVGASTGMLTVALAADLRSLIPGRAFCLKVGAATGAAYFIANLPFLFRGGPEIQALAPALGCLLAAGVLFRQRTARVEAQPSLPVLSASDCYGLGLATLIASFLALIWLDSAAFWIIQETVELRGQTWGAGNQTLVQGSAHLIGALVAGWLMDRAYFRSLLLGTFVLFSLAFSLLQGDHLPLIFAGPIYAVGISTYSTALVLAPSLGPAGEGLMPRRWRAALLYAIGGWMGSALGIGMAQDLHRIPAGFTWAAGAVLVGSAVLASRWNLRPALGSLGPALAIALTLSLVSTTFAEQDDDSLDERERGRRVYIAEGCIHCHSQYVRPNTRDTTLWGPAPLHPLSGEPPLLGLRRIGPDLSNVGARRPASWHRIHLEDPRLLSPGSRMPSYAHLFKRGDPRGPELVSYLSSLVGEER